MKNRLHILLIAVLGVFVLIACHGDFETVPREQSLPDGDDCATIVHGVSENRNANTGFNNTIGTSNNDRTDAPQFARVDGNFTGTTDEILQWAACKWGINEDIVRAQAIRESFWYQQAGGDKTTNQSLCHPLVRTTDGTSCPESIGILQVRYAYHSEAFEDANALYSTAYNADYAYASWRACFEGEYTWLNNVEHGRPYPQADQEDQLWGCLGVWFAGRWYTPAAETYIANVRGALADRVWEDPNFATAPCSSCHNVPPRDPPPPPTTTTTTTTTQPPTTTTTTSPPTTTTIPSQPGVYIEGFDSAASIDNFLWFVHNGANFHERQSHWHGDHNDDCQAPTTIRDVFMADMGTNPLTRLYDTLLPRDANGNIIVRDADPSSGVDMQPIIRDLVWWCNPSQTETGGHIMTGFQTAGYGQVDFSPNRTFTNVNRICWDVNGTNLGSRKWNQVVIVPEATFQANKGNFDHRLDYVIPRLQGGPGAAGLQLDGGVFAFETVQGNAVVHLGDGQTQGVGSQSIHQSNADKATRLTNCLVRNGTSTRVEQERLDGTVMVRTYSLAMPTGEVHIIFQDDNYNPDKAENPPTVTAPYTWHWDALRIESAG